MYWLSTKLFKLYFKLFYQLKIIGRENLLLKTAVIITPNHASFFDPPLMGAAIPEGAEFLAKESLFQPLFLGVFMRSMNAHPIKRGEGDIAAFKLMTKLLQQEKKVVIFPEGKRTSNGKLGPLHSGAARLSLRTKSPIIPVLIQGTYQAWPRGQKWPKLRGQITCTFLPALYPESVQTLPKIEQAEALTRRLSSLLSQADV